MIGISCYLDGKPCGVASVGGWTYLRRERPRRPALSLASQRAWLTASRWCEQSQTATQNVQICCGSTQRQALTCHSL